jgi:hypothetical protein
VLVRVCWSVCILGAENKTKLRTSHMRAYRSTDMCERCISTRAEEGRMQMQVCTFVRTNVRALGWCDEQPSAPPDCHQGPGSSRAPLSDREAPPDRHQGPGIVTGPSERIAKRTYPRNWTGGTHVSIQYLHDAQVGMCTRKVVSSWRPGTCRGLGVGVRRACSSRGRVYLRNPTEDRDV